jgi:hypothetical protein
MSEIIDFNDLRNKVKDSDVDKFEKYIYDLYFAVMDGSMTMTEFSRKIHDYMKDNNISEEKFIKIQTKFMERYGVDTSEIEKQLKSFGIDPNNFGYSDNESMKKTTSFYETYGHKIDMKTCITTHIKNETNDIKILIDQEKVTLLSNKKINLMDAQLNEFLLGYKNMLDKKIRIVICENITEYDY